MYLYVIRNLIHLTTCNFWMLYRKEARILKKPTIPLRDFIADVASSLCNIGIRRYGRPPLGSPIITKQSISNKYSTVYARCAERWFAPLTKDIPETPQMLNVFSKCIHLRFCAKCDVFLCFNKDRNCFYQFHK